MKKLTPVLVLIFAALAAACAPVQGPQKGSSSTDTPITAASPTEEAAATIGLMPSVTIEPTHEQTSTVNQDNLKQTVAALPAGPDYKNTTYEIEGTAVTLVNGMAEVEAAPGSATMITTRYFGNEAHGDLNGDGTEDVAFLLTQESGGSGVFFYVVAALRTNNGYHGTNAILLGDRIAPQSTYFDSGKVIVAYADRNPGEPFTTPPSLGVSKTLQVVDGILTEVK